MICECIIIYKNLHYQNILIKFIKYNEIFYLLLYLLPYHPPYGPAFVFWRLKLMSGTRPGCLSV